MGRGRPEPTKRDKQGRYKPDSKKCFIATSVYGDIDAPEVIILRQWRDDALSVTPLGRMVIKIYYKVAPAIADYLTLRPTLSNTVRKLLDRFINHITK